MCVHRALIRVPLDRAIAPTARSDSRAPQGLQSASIRERQHRQRQLRQLPQQLYPPTPLLLPLNLLPPLPHRRSHILCLLLVPCSIHFASRLLTFISIAQSGSGEDGNHHPCSDTKRDRDQGSPRGIRGHVIQHRRPQDSGVGRSCPGRRGGRCDTPHLRHLICLRCTILIKTVSNRQASVWRRSRAATVVAARAALLFLRPARRRRRSGCGSWTSYSRSSGHRRS